MGSPVTLTMLLPPRFPLNAGDLGRIVFNHLTGGVVRGGGGVSLGNP